MSNQQVDHHDENVYVDDSLQVSAQIPQSMKVQQSHKNPYLTQGNQYRESSYSSNERSNEDSVDRGVAKTRILTQPDDPRKHPHLYALETQKRQASYNSKTSHGPSNVYSKGIPSKRLSQKSSARQIHYANNQSSQGLNSFSPNRKPNFGSKP